MKPKYKVFYKSNPTAKWIACSDKTYTEETYEDAKKEAKEFKENYDSFIMNETIEDLIVGIWPTQ
jgi:hypothetical protein